MSNRSRLSFNRSSTSKTSEQTGNRLSSDTNLIESPKNSVYVNSNGGTPTSSRHHKIINDDQNDLSPTVYSMSQRAYSLGIDVTWGSPNRTTPVRHTNSHRCRTTTNVSACISPKTIFETKPSAGPKGLFKFLEELERKKINLNASKPMENDANIFDDDSMFEYVLNQNDDNGVNEHIPSIDNDDQDGMVVEHNLINLRSEDSPDTFSVTSDELPLEIVQNQNAIEPIEIKQTECDWPSRRDSFDDFICSDSIETIIKQSQEILDKIKMPQATTEPIIEDSNDSMDEFMISLDLTELSKNKSFGRFNSMPANVPETTIISSGVQKRKQISNSSSGYCDYMSQRISDSSTQNCKDTNDCSSPSFKKQKSMPISRSPAMPGISGITSLPASNVPLPIFTKEMLEEKRMKALELRKKSMMAQKWKPLHRK